MVKQITEWVTEDGTRCNTEQEAKDYELRFEKLAIIRPLIAVELPQLSSDEKEAVARFIVKGGKALLEIMASDEPFTSGEGRLGAPAGAQPSAFTAKGPDPCGPMPDTRDRSHPKPGREG